MALLARMALFLSPIMLAIPASAQAVDKDWWGVLRASPAIELRLVFHFYRNAEGKISGTLDSIDQSQTGLLIDNIVEANDHLALQLDNPSASYEGSWNAASNTWVGEWHQSGQSWPLTLAAGEAPRQPSQTQNQQLPANWDLPSNEQIRSLIDSRIATRQGEGIVVGVTDPTDTRIVAGGPVGQDAFDDRTIFEIGSMSKAFTALILADMTTKGEVSLDDPAEKYLPAGAKMPERNGRKITLRDLATHTSGLPRLPDNMPMGNPNDPYADYSEKLLIEFLDHYQLTRDIGSQFEYSNLGFGLLGYLLSRAAHTDYAALLAQRITTPLGMHDTAILLSPEQQSRFAEGHDNYMRPTSPWTLPALAGAGAIRSSASDMLVFLRAAMDPQSPIAPAMKLAAASQWPVGKSGLVGLAWMIGTSDGGNETLSHDGGTGGFRTMMALEPAKQRAVVVLANAAVEPSVVDLANHILFGAPLTPTRPVSSPPAPRTFPKEVAISSSEFDRVVGRYEFSDAQVLTVQRSSNGVEAKLIGQPSFPIFPEAPLHFFWRVVDAKVEFTTDSTGKVTGAVLTQGGRRKAAKRTAP